MSLLMYGIQPDRLDVVVDTVVGNLDGSVHGESDKLHPITHLGAAIGGTGVEQLVRRYVDWVRHLRPATFDEIGEIGTLHLPILAHLVERDAPMGDLTTTIYQFGWSESLGRYVVHVLRSITGWQLEVQTLETTYHKPEHPDGRVSMATADDIIASAEAIHAAQQARPPHERVVTGGSLLWTTLSDEGASITTTRIHRLAD